MQLELNGKTYQLHFGIEFIRQIDKRYENGENGGQGYGFGISFLFQKLMRTASPVAIADVIHAATATELNPPTAAEIENFLSAEDTDLAQLSQDFYQALQRAPLPGKAVFATLRKLGIETPAAPETEQSEDETAKTPISV